MKRDAKGRWDVEAEIEFNQPAIPANATPVHNPHGFMSQVPSGSMLNGAGGDGMDYNNWGARADGDWNANPMPQGLDPWGATPGNATFARKANKRKK